MPDAQSENCRDDLRRVMRSGRPSAGPSRLLPSVIVVD